MRTAGRYWLFTTVLTVLLLLAESKKEPEKKEDAGPLPWKRDFKTFEEGTRSSSAGSLSDLLKGLTFTEYPTEVLRASALHYLSPDWAPLDKQLSKSPGFGNLTAKFFSKLEDAHGTISCVWDQSLNNGSRLLQNKRIFIAANFKDNEAVLPHLLVQMWHTIALLPEGAVFVSIYESSSKDETGFWLGKYAELFQALKVPYRINADGAIAYVGHNLVQRIELLSRVRNAALEPLWDGEELWHIDDPPPESGARHPARLRKPHSQARRRLARLPPTHIIFTNDVYACARDNIRLLYHDADMACGTDWWVNDGVLTFYDIWVARDITGYRLEWHPPYLKDSLSQKRMAEGLHVPVQSCWNGLVAMRAAPFMNRNLKFRLARSGECFASECKLICDDLKELGFSNIIMDPGVRMTYLLPDAVDAFKPDRVKQIKVTDWADIKASPIDSLDFGYSETSMCCPLSQDRIYVDWEKCSLDVASI